jgi:hypothetical protein
MSAQSNMAPTKILLLIVHRSFGSFSCVRQLGVRQSSPITTPNRALKLTRGYSDRAEPLSRPGTLDVAQSGCRHAI